MGGGRPTVAGGRRPGLCQQHQLGLRPSGPPTVGTAAALLAARVAVGCCDSAVRAVMLWAWRLAGPCRCYRLGSCFPSLRQVTPHPGCSWTSAPMVTSTDAAETARAAGMQRWAASIQGRAAAFVGRVATGRASARVGATAAIACPASPRRSRRRARREGMCWRRLLGANGTCRWGLSPWRCAPHLPPCRGKGVGVAAMALLRGCCLLRAHTSSWLWTYPAAVTAVGAFVGN